MSVFLLFFKVDFFLVLSTTKKRKKLVRYIIITGIKKVVNPVPAVKKEFIACKEEKDLKKMVKLVFFSFSN